MDPMQSVVPMSVNGSQRDDGDYGGYDDYDCGGKNRSVFVVVIVQNVMSGGNDWNDWNGSNDWISFLASISTNNKQRNQYIRHRRA